MKKQVQSKDKKISTSDLRAIANRILALPDNTMINNDYRRGIISLLEEALSKAEAYRGFNHHHWMATGYDQWVNAGKPDFPQKDSYIGNQYRRFYF